MSHDDKVKGRRHTRLIVLGALAVIVLSGGAWFAHHQLRGKYLESTNDAQIRANMVTVAPRVAGYVAEVLVRDNQDVRAGQPLLRIDARDYEARLAEAAAQVSIAGAAADNGRASIQEQYAKIEESRAQLAQARVKAAYDAAQVARYVPLAQSGAETGEQLALLRSVSEQSAALVRAQDAALAAQRRRIDIFESQIRQSNSQADSGRARLALANIDVDATLVRAAADGRVGDMSVTDGQFVQPGMRLMSIVPLDKLYVVANFKETQLDRVWPGQPVTVRVDALSGAELQGQVASITPGTGAQFSLLPPENATGNFTKIVQRVPVRIELRATGETRRLLVPGLSVTATIDTISAKGAQDRAQHADKRAMTEAR